MSMHAHVAARRPRLFEVRPAMVELPEHDEDTYGLALEDDEIRLMVELNGMVGIDPEIAMVY